MGGRLSDRLQGLLLDYHATLPADAMDALLDDDQDQASRGEDLSIFLCHLILHRHRLPSRLLSSMSELLVPPHVSSDHAALLQAAARTHPDARISSPRHLRTLLLTLGAHGPHPPLPSSMHYHLLARPPPPPKSPTKSGTDTRASNDVRHRAALTRAITREMESWGLADDYFHFPSSSSSSSYSSSTGGESCNNCSGSAAIAATRNSIRLNYVPRPQRGFTVAVWFRFDDAEEREGKGGGGKGIHEGGGQKKGFSLFRFQSHHHSKKDTSVEAVLESWGEDSWQLVYRCYTPGHSQSVHTVREVLTLPRGQWQLLTLSHSLPYLSLLKRSQVRVALNGVGRSSHELPYPSPPSSLPPSDAEAWRQGLIMDGFEGGAFAGLSLYADVLSDDLLGLLYRGGPNLPYLACPSPIPPTGAIVEDAIRPLGSEHYKGPLAEAAALVPLAFSFHATLASFTPSAPSPPPPASTPSSLPPSWEGWLHIPPPGSSRADYWSFIPPLNARAIGGGGGGAGAVGGMGRVRLKQGEWGWAALFPLGGVASLMAVATEGGKEGGREGLTAWCFLMAGLLRRHPAHREAFLHVYGFHVVASLWRRGRKVGREGGKEGAVEGCLALVEACGGARGGELLWAGVQGLGMAWEVWREGTFGEQVKLLGRMVRWGEENAGGMRACVGVQGVVDWVYLLRCPGECGKKKQKEEEEEEEEEGGLEEGVERTLLLELAEPLLVAMIDHGLTGREKVEEERVGYDDGQHPLAASLALHLLSDSDPNSRPDILPLLRCLHHASAAIRTAAAAVSTATTAGGEKASTPPSLPPSLPSSPSFFSALQVSILRVLITVRASHPELLWRDLVRFSFDRHLAFLLLTQPSPPSSGLSSPTDESARRLCLDLWVWLLQIALCQGPSRLALYTALGEPQAYASLLGWGQGEGGWEGGVGGGIHSPTHSGFDDAGAGAALAARDEDLVMYGKNMERVKQIVLWVGRGVRDAVDGGTWGEKITAETLAAIWDVSSSSLPSLSLSSSSSSLPTSFSSGTVPITGTAGSSSSNSSSNSLLWVLPPLLAALLPLAPPSAQEDVLTRLNLTLKADEKARRGVLDAGREFWLPHLLRLAAMGWRKREEGGGEGGKEEGREERQAWAVPEELALDALATLALEEMMGEATGGGGGEGEGEGGRRDRRRRQQQHQQWQQQQHLTLLPCLVEEINFINVRLPPSSSSSFSSSSAPSGNGEERLEEGGQGGLGGTSGWGRMVLTRLCTMLLQRVARSGALLPTPSSSSSSVPFFSSSPPTINMRIVIKLLSIVEERIFPLTLQYYTQHSTSPSSSSTSSPPYSSLAVLSPQRPTLSLWEARLLSVILEFVNLRPHFKHCFWQRQHQQH
ncbi:Hypothetical protein NocV09_08400150 [Nannochloropsis oceanica]